MGEDSDHRRPSFVFRHAGVRARASQEKSPGHFHSEPERGPRVDPDRGFVGVPFLALLAAVPLAWGWAGLARHRDRGAFYVVSGLGVTVGFHRYSRIARSRPSGLCTSRWRSPAASRWKDRSLNWVANHRRHHSTPTATVTRTRHGGSAPTGRRWQRAWPTPTWAGSSTGTRRHGSGSAPTCWPTGGSAGSRARSPC